MAFLFFHGILCDTVKKSRGKNLIIVPLIVPLKFIATWKLRPQANVYNVPYNLRSGSEKFVRQEARTKRANDELMRANELMIL